MAFAEDIKAAIALLGGPDGERAVDFILDPGAAWRALDAVKDGGGLIVRAMREHGAQADGFEPTPVDPVWIRIMRGAREVGTALYRGGDGMVRRAARVEIDEREEGCCDASACERKRTHVTVWIALEGAGKGGAEERILVSEERVAETAPEVSRGVAAKLAAFLGVPLKRGGEDVTLVAGEAPEAMGEALDVVTLARVSMRTEGDRTVVRDWDSVGPRASATRNAWIGAVILVFAAGAWVMLARALGDPAQGSALGYGVTAALLTLTGYTFVGVARFSAKYAAHSEPLIWIGRDRLVVQPWVSREGAVDSRPEGRLGAALPLAEVRLATSEPSAGSIAAQLDTDHGPYDVVICPDRAAAELWSAILNRAIDEARHPRAGATARQRARAKQLATA